MRDRPWEVTDADVDALRARYTDDQLFEAVVAMVIGAAEVRFRAGLERGLETGLRPLVRLFERRLGRPLSYAERGALASRLDVVDPDRLGDVVLDLDSAALAAWLASTNAT